MNKRITTREYFIDNLRFILIFLVVIGHVLEIVPSSWGSVLLYKTIYAFHMPAFLFIFGYFAKFNPKRLIFNWVIPYIVFQTLYIFFNRIILGNEMILQYTTPYWLLWYMMTCIIYQIILAIVDTQDKRKQALILLLSVLAALLVGFANSVGYYLSLSRTIVFLPWFLLGAYFRKNGGFSSHSLSKRGDIKLLLVSLFACIFAILFIYKINIPSKLLYGSYSYSAIGQTVWMRLLTMVMALSFMVFLFAIAKVFMNKKIPFITNMGQYTLPIFLLHGFIIKSISHFCPALVSGPIYALPVAFLILVLLGNKWSKQVVYYIGFYWLEKLGIK